MGSVDATVASELRREGREGVGAPLAIAFVAFLLGPLCWLGGMMLVMCYEDVRRSGER